MSRRIACIAPTAEPVSLMVGLRLAGRRVLVVGGGSTATQRARQLADAGADVRVVAPKFSAELASRQRRGELRIEQRAFEDRDLEDATLVAVAVDDPRVSERVATLCRAARVLVNVADVPALCDYYFPAVARDGPVQIAVSTDGSGPGLAARLRDHVARTLPRDVSPAVIGFARLRRTIRHLAPGPAGRRRRMAWLADAAHMNWEALAALDRPAIDLLARRFLAGLPAAPRRGRVRLVGAGPGDPELLTQAALRAIREAELVLADRLVPQPIRDLVRGQLVVADKQPGCADAAQADLNARMLSALERGLDVVRLKAGDPGLFGRAGEELELLERAGFLVEVIPAVSAALAAPASLGVPLTARGIADRVLMCTGQGKGGSVPRAPRFEPNTTYVLFMAIGRLRSLCARLMANGFPSGLPAACVSQASQPAEQRVISSLAELPAAAERARLEAPALVILGNVVAAAERISQQDLATASNA